MKQIAAILLMTISGVASHAQWSNAPVEHTGTIPGAPKESPVSSSVTNSWTNAPSQSSTPIPGARPKDWEAWLNAMSNASGSWTNLPEEGSDEIPTALLSGWREFSEWVRRELNGKAGTNDLDASLITGAILASDIYPAWTNAGGIVSTTLSITTPVLSNGICAVTYESQNLNMISEEVSFDGGLTWSEFSKTNVPVCLKLTMEKLTTPMVVGVASISNIIAYSWSSPATVGRVNRTRGQHLQVDDPESDQDAVPLGYVVSAIGNITPSRWASYKAGDDVNLNGHRMILGNGWSLTQTNGFGVLSYADVFSATNGAVIGHNGTPVALFQSGAIGLRVDQFRVQASNIVFGISTNGVSAEPRIEQIQDLLGTEWTTMEGVGTYPAQSNGVFEIIVTKPLSNTGFFRAIQESGENRMSVNGSVVATRFVGDGSGLTGVAKGGGSLTNSMGTYELLIDEDGDLCSRRIQ